MRLRSCWEFSKRALFMAAMLAWIATFAAIAPRLNPTWTFAPQPALATRDSISGQLAYLVSTSTTIANAATTSAEIDLEDYCLNGFQYATMTGTTLTATCSNVLGGTYVALNGADNSAWSITIGDDRFVDLTQGGEAICGCRFMRLVSGSSEGGARTIQLVLGR